MMDELARKRAEKAEKRRREAQERRESLEREEAVEMAALHLAEYVRFREAAVEAYRDDLEDRYPEPDLRDAVARAIVDHEVDEEFEGEAG